MAWLLSPDEAGLARAAALLRSGRLVAFPTETVYGLGARADDPRAVAAVFRAKGRPADHPLIVHLARPEEAPAWADPFPPAAVRLAHRFWPGPLTLVVRRAPQVLDAVTGGQATLALRVPDHPHTHALLRRVGSGVAAPSANRFGHVSPTRARHVLEEFSEEDVAVLDGGDCAVGLESTIVDLSAGRPRLLRPGAITAADLAAELGEEVAPASEAPEGEPTPRTPGRLPRHYAPTTPARVVSAGVLARPGGVPREGALLVRTATPPAGHLGPVRRLPLDAVGYGRELYAALRELDQAGAGSLWIERPPPGAAWTAVRDRLERATSAAPDPGSDGTHGASH